MYYQTQDHLVRLELYPTLQSAYRAGHSTETALLKVHNDTLLNMDNQRVTLLVLLDLSSAFDTVDHEVLIRRLEITFGIADTALQWFRSYLAGRISLYVMANRRVRVWGRCFLQFMPASYPLGDSIKEYLQEQQKNTRE